MRHLRSLSLIAALALMGACNAIDATAPELPSGSTAAYDYVPPPPPPPDDPTMGSGN